MVEEFIKRRFSTNCGWLDSNCYYFALILNDRFSGGAIYYDVTYGHFVFGLDGHYYDWCGEVTPKGKLVKWEEILKCDCDARQRIIEGCLR